MTISPNQPWWVVIWPILNIILLLVIAAASVYAFILFVKFAKLGIKAFRIYIDKNKS
jgi:hypothetical protein